MNDLVLNDYVRCMDEQFSMYEWFARQYGMTHKSLQILLWIRNYPRLTNKFVTQKLLVQKTYSSKQVVNAAIKAWEKKAYVELLDNPADRRQRFVQLTKTGEAFAGPIYQKLAMIENKAAQALIGDDQKRLVELTKRYNQVMKAEMEKLNDTL